MNYDPIYETKTNLDPHDPFESAIWDMVKMNRKKRADYAGNGNPFQNFIDSAYQINTVPGMSCEQLIATKQARLRNLINSGRVPQNESVEDTILDRAVYAAIALAMYRQGLYSYVPECGVDVPECGVVPMDMG